MILSLSVGEEVALGGGFTQLFLQSPSFAASWRLALGSASLLCWLKLGLGNLPEPCKQCGVPGRNRNYLLLYQSLKFSWMLTVRGLSSFSRGFLFPCLFSAHRTRGSPRTQCVQNVWHTNSSFLPPSLLYSLMPFPVFACPQFLSWGRGG